MGLKVSISLCCRNECENLPIVLGRLHWLDSALGSDLWEVIVIDGWSDDGSTEILQETARQWPKLRVLRQEPPAGYGSAYRQSVLACGGDVIVTCDADLNYDVRDCVGMLSRLAEHDLVVANPFGKGGRSELGFFRNLPTRTVAVLYRLALLGCGSQVRIFTPILRVGWARVFKGGLPKANDFRASAEFVVRAILRGETRITEVPVTVHERGGGRSKLSFFRTVLAHLGLACSILKYRLTGRGDLLG